MVYIAELVLMGMRLIVFALALGLTLISFQAYLRKKTDRLEAAFIGFAFLSIAIAVSTMRPQDGSLLTIFQVVETIPFIIGFSMLYLSLYR